MFIKINYIKIKLNFLNKLFYTIHKNIFTNVHRKTCTWQNFAFAKSVNLSKCEMCICRNLHCAEICICRKVCSADLRILCTDSFCTFADLRICVLHLCRIVISCFAHLQKTFRTCRNIFENIAQEKFVCEHKKRKIPVFSRKSKSLKKSKKPKMSRKCPKKALCKLYIYRKGEAFLAPFCVLFPSVEKRPRKVGGISSSPTKFLVRILVWSPHPVPPLMLLLAFSVTRVAKYKKI